jgi:hypothetical protein
MSDSSNFSRAFIASLTSFMEGFMFRGLGVPKRKLLMDLAFGMLKSGVNDNINLSVSDN